MSDNTEVLDFLRTRFARVDEALAKIDYRLDELTGRVGRMELAVADQSARIARVEVGVAEHSVRMDRLSGSVERINRRLELVEQP